MQLGCGSAVGDDGPITFTEEWVGFDIDATLAHYDGVLNLIEIGAPVEPMRERLLSLVNAGKYEVKILTARAGWPGQKQLIESWLAANQMPRLDITDRKDFRMAFCFDDR